MRPGDHTQLDIWALDANEQSARPWITIILDDYSRAVVGFRVGFDASSSLRTAFTRRQAIWRKADPRWHVCGILGTFYTDHGYDFASEHLEQVAADLKLQLVFSTPGEPRGGGGSSGSSRPCTRCASAACPATRRGVRPNQTLP